MKLTSFFAGILMSIMIVLACNAQTQTGRVTWTANAPEDSVSEWHVYYEYNNANSGFFLQDGMSYNATLETGGYLQTVIPNTGQVGDITYDIAGIPLSGGWAVAGVVAFGAVPSDVGVSGSQKLVKKPGKPAVIFQIIQEP